MSRIDHMVHTTAHRNNDPSSDDGPELVFEADGRVRLDVGAEVEAGQLTPDGMRALAAWLLVRAEGGVR